MVGDADADFIMLTWRFQPVILTLQHKLGMYVFISSDSVYMVCKKQPHVPPTTPHNLITENAAVRPMVSAMLCCDVVWCGGVE